MWVFGYGSLTWKVDFPYVSKLDGYIIGYIRRFYQHSVDHRGVPQTPGRVVTLLPATDEDRVYGVAYNISPEDTESVIAHLDYREKDGYRKETVLFYPVNSDSQPFELTMYIATESNKCYAGPLDISSIARQVVNAVGPSGSNKEYVYNLANAMRCIAPDYVDDHLRDLEMAVKSLDTI